jgi:hypothetical protein
METMREKTRVSPADEPLLLQVLVAVTIKHHNYNVLKKLPPYKSSTPSMFSTAASAMEHWIIASKPAAGIRAALTAGGWTALLDSTGDSNDGAASQYDEALKEDLKNHFSMGRVLDVCVEDRPSAHLRAYFPSISRSLYDGIPPHHKWPGDPTLVKKASARTDADGVEVLRLLIEIGGMDVNDSSSWWKEGDHDYREWNPKNFDQSDCTETPLHVAVDSGNLAMIEYLLSRGAQSMKDGYGRNQLDRAVLRKRPAVIELFRKFGW